VVDHSDVGAAPVSGDVDVDVAHDGGVSVDASSGRRDGSVDPDVDNAPASRAVIPGAVSDGVGSGPPAGGGLVGS
jgi:hypothetical protein